ncbi:VOC family protein [Streptomonospora sp. S1-112]|uniref:VOC family protein n=1 Tax=Streptomonospora mangrovi TaxID=2883123 RepID=A0A9X3NIT0_9ACTN|nr:VOC family protein [Streptomonospora mangrovi]MDA0563978.1 VOC family protein [Streptomonospora mangrovi]
MTTAVEYPAGAPCWMDLSVPDLDLARRFYGGVLGWEFDDLPYSMARLNGRRVAGLSQRWGPDPEAEAARSAAWTVYLATQSLAGTLEAVTNAGGRPLGVPQDIGDLGAMAIARDPAGAVFGMWEPGTLRGAEAYGEPGAPVWSEVTSGDVEAASAFLVRVFGYEPERLAGYDFVTLYSGGTPVCGVYGGTADRPSRGLAAWLTYFAVRSADDAAALAQDSGGTVVDPPADSPFGRRCLLADPFGARFAAVEPAERSGPAGPTAPPPAPR